MRNNNYFFLTIALCLSAINLYATPPTTPTTSAKGTVKLYSREAFTGYRSTSYREELERIYGVEGEWVFADDNATVYLKNPVSSYGLNSYLVGTRNGNKVTFEMPQPLGTVAGKQIQASRMVYAPDQYGDWYNVDNSQPIEFDINDDGSITIADYGIASSGRPQVVIGITQGATYSWYIHTEGDVTYTPVANDPIKALPSGFNAVPWSMTCVNGVPQVVNVAVNGSDIYMTPFPDKYPGVYVKGTISNGKAIFQSNQYLGSYTQDTSNNDDQKTRTELAFFTGMKKTDNEYKRTATVEFDYSGNSMSFTDIMAINCGQGPACLIFGIEAPSLQLQGTDIEFKNPKPAEVLNAIPRIESLGHGYLIFDLPPYDVNENLYDITTAYYELYVNNELYTFKRTDYAGLPSATLTQIPYSYSDGNNIIAEGSRHTLNFFFSGTPKVGIKVAFKDTKGNLHESAMTEVDLSDVFPQGIEYTNAQKSETELFGTSKLEDYSAAIQLKDKSLEGRQVTGVKIPVVEDDNLEYTIWLTKELKSEYKDGKYENVADIVEIPAKPLAGELYVKFPEAYTIGEDGVYVGYTTKVKALTDVTKTPLIVTNEIVSGGFMLQSTRSYVKWADQGSAKGMTLAMCAIINGVFYDDAAGVYYVDDIDLEPDMAGSTTVTIANHGTNKVSSVEYTYEVGGKTGSGSYTFPTPIAAAYNRKGSFTVEVPAIADANTYEMKVTVTKVNGKENLDPTASGIGYVNVLDETPDHRAVLEEYTGTWCGWCPRGLVGLKKMNEKYPDTFIGVSYHSSDIMEMTASYPQMVDGFPAAWIDRMVSTDAYGGESSYAFGVDKVWEKRCSVKAPCHVNVSAEWVESSETNKKYIEVKCETRFVKTVRDEYRIAYVLLADGLKGNTSDWLQSNSYSSNSNWENVEDMKSWVEAGGLVSGVEYDDVAIFTSGHYGIEGSLNNIAPFVNNTHVYEIQPEFAVSKTGEYLIQNENNLKVVAMVIRFPLTDMGDVTEYGEIVNADMCAIGSASVAELENAAEVAKVTYYNLSGAQVINPAAGIYVKKTVFADGTEKAEKVIVK